MYNNYNKVMLIGDLNEEEAETVPETFLYRHDLKNLVKGGTCYKNNNQDALIYF